MKKLIFLPILFISLSAGAVPNERSLKEVLADWQSFETGVRDNRIPKEEARAELKSLLSELSGAINSKYQMESGSWVFPIKGYSRKAMNKDDFNPASVYGPYGVKGYDFFDGNRHGGHPAYDIFIRDKNQDSLDDKTKRNVKLLAMSDMLVLSLNNGWKKGSKMRGGNYIWLINPREKKLFYYAHMKDIFVKPGEFVRKGDALGTVGRTGYLADKKTSPTHVHLMVLEYDQGILKPFDYLPLLPKLKK